MRDRNLVILQGKVAADPQVREGAGSAFVTLRVKTHTPRWRTGTDYMGPRTENNHQTHTVHVVGTDAEFARLMAAGTPVQVTGYLEARDVEGERASAVVCTELLRLYEMKVSQIPADTDTEGAGEAAPFDEEEA